MTPEQHEAAADRLIRSEAESPEVRRQLMRQLGTLPRPDLEAIGRKVNAKKSAGSALPGTGTQTPG